MFCCFLSPIVIPVARRDVSSAHQNLAVLIQFHMLTGQNSADGAARSLKRVVDADKRRSLGHPIALNHRESEALPELFRIGIECCPARDECPEFPAEHLM